MGGACGSCHAPVYWAMTTTGKKAPIDEPIVATGNVMLIHPRGWDWSLAVTLSGDTLRYARRRGVPLHLNHWATCPDKAEWRAKQEAKRARAGG